MFDFNNFREQQTSQNSFIFAEGIVDQLYNTSQDQFIFQGIAGEIVKVDATNLNDMIEIGRGRLNMLPEGVSADHGKVSVMGNLIFVGNDTGTGSGFIVHQTEKDLKGPEVNMVVPSDGQTNRALTSRIGLTFTDNVDLQSVNTNTLIVRPIGGTAIPGKYSHQFLAVNFTPDEPLLPETTYEIIVSANGLTDWIGNPTETEFRSTFTTAAENISAEDIAQARMETAEALMTPEEWIVYPNTTKGQVSIILPPSQQVESITGVTVMNVQGQIFKSTHFKELGYLDVNFEAPEGLYLILIESNDEIKKLKVIKTE